MNARSAGDSTPHRQHMPDQVRLTQGKGCPNARLANAPDSPDLSGVEREREFTPIRGPCRA